MKTKLSASQYWLVKSEPSVYSIDDLKKDKVTYWDGVRNFQARNFMRDRMKKGDWVLFYHSNAEPPGVAGIAKVHKEGYPDFTSWDKKDKHFDPKSSEQKPLWFMVDLEFYSKFKQFVPLEALKANAKLKDMMVVKPAVRLSVQPVSQEHFEAVLKMGGQS